MAARTPKIPARNTLLSSSLNGMDDLFDFQTKDTAEQPSPQGLGPAEMDFDRIVEWDKMKFDIAVDDADDFDI